MSKEKSSKSKEKTQESKPKEIIETTKKEHKRLTKNEALRKAYS